jgi:hypothetical protein
VVEEEAVAAIVAEDEAEGEATLVIVVEDEVVAAIAVEVEDEVEAAIVVEVEDEVALVTGEDEEEEQHVLLKCSGKRSITIQFGSNYSGRSFPEIRTLLSLHLTPR